MKPGQLCSNLLHKVLILPANDQIQPLGIRARDKIPHLGKRFCSTVSFQSLCPIYGKRSFWRETLGRNLFTP